MRTRFRVFAWYIGPVGLLAAVAGFLALAWTRFWKDPVLLTAGVLAAAFFFYKIRIVPENFWQARRYLPLILPFACLMMAAGAFVAYRRRLGLRPHPVPRRAQDGRRIAVAGPSRGRPRVRGVDVCSRDAADPQSRGVRRPHPGSRAARRAVRRQRTWCWSSPDTRPIPTSWRRRWRMSTPGMSWCSPRRGRTGTKSSSSCVGGPRIPSRVSPRGWRFRPGFGVDPDHARAKRPVLDSGVRVGPQRVSA